MSSYSKTVTFSATNAKHLASKVASDLYQCSILYDCPSASHVVELEAEIAVLLEGGYLSTYEFGFKSSSGRRVLTWFYRVDASGNLSGGADDRSGGIQPGVDLQSAHYFNFLSYSDSWTGLTAEEKEIVKNRHPVDRGYGEPPVDGTGYWQEDRSYSSGGVGVSRRTYRP